MRIQIMGALIGCLLLASSVTAATIDVKAGGDLQAALTAAKGGDTIVLEAGARFVGQFRFPAKDGVVIVRSSGVCPDRRIAPEDAPLLATIASGAAMMAVDLYDSKNWTLDCIRFEPNTAGAGEIIGLWRSDNIVLRRLLFVVPALQQQKRFVLGNGTRVTFTQSYCSGVWWSEGDSQCFVAWDGAGPYTITDNFLEAASENIMFGGSDSSSETNVPSDVLVENNLFTKRAEWKGQPRGVKNLFELKAARRVVVRGNTFEHNWIDAQPGRAIVVTPRNQSGTAPWTVVSDVLFERNVVRDTPTCISVLGYDDISPSQQTTRIVFRDNDLTCSGSIGVLLMAEAGRVEYYRNRITVPPQDAAFLSLSSTESQIATATGKRAAQFAVQSLVWAENVTPNGYIHSPSASGEAALKAYTQAYSLVVPGDSTPTDPVTPPVDPVAQLQAELAQVKADAAATRARLDKLLADLRATPSVGKIAQLVAYLRGVTK